MNRLRQQIEQLDLNAYKCYHCHGLIGMTTRDTLFIGAAKFIKSITMECGYCNKLTFWKPSGEIISDKRRQQ